jgi:hypothetical protein
MQPFNRQTRIASARRKPKDRACPWTERSIQTIVPPRPRRAHGQCCWPLGEPRRADSRFCEARAASGKPYCAEYVIVAYARREILQNDAA